MGTTRGEKGVDVAEEIKFNKMEKKYCKKGKRYNLKKRDFNNYMRLKLTTQSLKDKLCYMYEVYPFQATLATDSKLSFSAVYTKYHVHFRIRIYDESRRYN